MLIIPDGGTQTYVQDGSCDRFHLTRLDAVKHDHGHFVVEFNCDGLEFEALQGDLEETIHLEWQQLTSSSSVHVQELHQGLIEALPAILLFRDE